MIHEEICTYEVCKLAKEKGFNEPTDRYYHIYDDVIEAQNSLEMTGSGCADVYNSLNQCRCSAPTQALLQRWLREERGIIVEVFVDDESNMPLTYNIHQYKDWNWVCVCHHHGNYYAVNDWELCLEDALKYALENLV
jgi:hypothetical protein